MSSFPFFLNRNHGIWQIFRIDIDAKDIDGETAFIIACWKGHTYVVQLLLNHPNSGIDFNAKSKYLGTAFMAACTYRQKDVVKSCSLTIQTELSLMQEMTMERLHSCGLAIVTDTKMSFYYYSTIQTQALSLMQRIILGTQHL